MSGPADRRKAGEGWRPDPKRVIASLPMAVIMLAPDPAIASVNTAAEQLTGQGARRLVGKMVEDVFAFDEQLILSRLTEGDAQLFARDAGVRVLAPPGGSTS